jgi:putative peptidoglycan lipid II flippase
MFGYVILICAVGFLSAILNAFSDFVLAAAVPILLNVFLILGLLVFRADLYALAATVLVAGIVQILILSARIGRRKFGLRLVRPRATRLMKSMTRRMGWGMLGSGFYQLNIFIGVLLASYQSGAVSYLYYSDRMVQLPFAIIGLAAGTVILTKVSDAIAAKKMGAVHQYQNAAMKNSMMLTLPCAAGLFVLAEPIVRFLFEYGEWTPAATSAVAAAIMIQVFALPLMTSSQIYLKTLYASGDVRTPVRISAVALAIGIAVMLAASGRFGYLCVPIGTVASGAVRNIWMKRACGSRGLYKTDPGAVRAIAAFGALSIAMAAALWFARSAITGLFPLVVSIALAAIIYLPLALFCDKIIKIRKEKL